MALEIRARAVVSARASFRTVNAPAGLGAERLSGAASAPVVAGPELQLNSLVESKLREENQGDGDTGRDVGREADVQRDGSATRTKDVVQASREPTRAGPNTLAA